MNRTFIFYLGCPLSKRIKESVAENYVVKSTTKEIADPETTTPNGCRCSSICGTSLDEAFEYDWCYTADKDNGEHCGEWSIVYGYWDKCLYLDSSKPDYVVLDWKAKHDRIWEDIKADDSFDAFHPLDLFTESVKTTFDCEWDVLPAGRVKAIHGVGAVCPFVVNIESSPFTGLYKTGVLHGLIRMGAGIDFTDPLNSGFLPGAAVKYLRTGRSSVNYVLFKNSLHYLITITTCLQFPLKTTYQVK